MLTIGGFNLREVIIVSHGKLAVGMLDTVEMFAGKSENVKAFSMLKDQTPDYIFDSLKNEIDKHPEMDYIIFTDIAGGSVNTQAMKFLNKSNVRIISGMNLPMIINCVLSKDEPLDKLVEVGKNSVSEIKEKKYNDENIWED